MFYRDTKAVMSYIFNPGTSTFTTVTPKLSSVKEDLDTKERWFRDWCGKFHYVHIFGGNIRDSLLNHGNASLYIVIMAPYSKLVAGRHIHREADCSAILYTSSLDTHLSSSFNLAL
jgi:hypothetical protein